MKTCSNCEAKLQTSTKFCGSCGCKVEEDSATESLDAFRTYVLDILANGFRLEDVVDQLMEAAVDLAVSKSAAVSIIEQCSHQSIKAYDAAVELFYDSDQAAAGIVSGNTVLAFKLRNISGKNLKSAVVKILNPESGSIVTFPELRGLVKGLEKSVETDLRFDRPGRYAIREGILSLAFLGGGEAHFSLSSPIRLIIESGSSLKANIQSINQTIQTHGGGVISAGGISHEPSSIPIPTNVWTPISIIPIENYAVSDWLAKNETGSNSQLPSHDASNGELFRSNKANRDPALQPVDLPDNLLPDADGAISEQTEEYAAAPDQGFVNGLGKEVQDNSSISKKTETDDLSEGFCNHDHILQFFDMLSAMSIEVNGQASATIFTISHDITDSLSQGLSELIVDDIALAVGTSSTTILNDKGQLSAFVGSATIVGTKGIYHVKGDDSVRYQLDGRAHFASWFKLLSDCDMSIKINPDHPSIWLGNEDTIFIDGAYIDYSQRIDLWIQFRKYACLDLFGNFRNFTAQSLGT